MTIAFLVISLFGFLLVGVPVAASLGLSTILTFWLFTDMPMVLVGQRLYQNLDHFPLMAVPFFILAGQLAQTGGIAQRLVNLAQSFIGHFPGGLAMTSILACAFFAAASGSSSATVAAVGSILMPAMMRAGYPKELAIGSVATAGSLGILIPPSIPMLIYALITEQSVGKLFLAGVLPGLFFCAILLLVTYITSRRMGLDSLPKASGYQRLVAFKKAGWSLMLPVIILGGIYGYPDIDWGPIQLEGAALFTPTEASIAAVVYSFIVGKFIYRELSWGDVQRVVMDSLRVTSMLLFIVTNAILFGFLLASERIPAMVAEWIVAQEVPQWLFLLMVNIVLAIAGQFMDGIPIIMIFVPVLFAAANAIGVDPIHLCIIIVVNLELGTITPPVGVNLFVASALVRMALADVIRATLPWIVVVIGVLMVITYWPWLSLVLVQ
jgi:C4-dicarboxylate transporter DctM subunit